MMSEGNERISDRVTRLETWREEVNRRLGSIDDKIDKITNNELTHLDERIMSLENRKRDRITWTDLAKIIVAVIGGAALVAATFIQYVLR